MAWDIGAFEYVAQTQARVTQGPVEVALDEDVAPSAAVTQGAVEVSLAGDAAAATVTQGAVEVVIISDNDPQQVTQVVAEYSQTRTDGSVSLTQLLTEAAISGTELVTRASQLVLEYLWAPYLPVQAPGFIPGPETTYAQNTDTTVATETFQVTVGDLVIAYAMQQVWVSGEGLTAPTASANVGTFTLVQQVAVADYCDAAIWSATATSTGTVTVTFNRNTPGSSRYWGGRVLIFRESEGISTSGKVNAGVGAPELSLQTNDVHTCWVTVCADVTASDGSSRAWRQINPTADEQTYSRLAGAATLYGAVHYDVDVPGTYTTGLTAPDTQQYAMAAVVVRGKKRKLPDPLVYLSRRRRG